MGNDTKRKIDAARDVLVGKVPNPQTQVEQITIAMIYKFMDDMDKDAEELAGKAQFFTGKYKKYSWSNIIDPKLGGNERLNLYAEAITQMSRNDNLPQLFREIFEDAFLPYRDPETLSLFLKEIDGFDYSQGDKLGDVYEYLLSILGTQKKLGQFRTPRHIIDFIVKVVNPKKDETILDPACGTAGFLISSYKHILKLNGKETPGDQLTPEEKTKLMNNFVGYDVEPIMRKFSLVNMYLHGFPNPKIYEYDTLSSEEKWDDYYDVILANPPFMTPRGGIRPHKRFAIQANRSEVLFVDYILEHLNINGRAGIIVPEGIIFKTNNAYKALRKKLVEDGLLAVVSLPQGVFNPYSGVKTSILLFDNELAKKTDEILFINVENDGYGLGAQRRKIEANDLPLASYYLELWKGTLEKGGKKVKLKGKKKWDNASWIKKTKIAEDGDYNLTASRHAQSKRSAKITGKWSEVELQDVAEIDWGNTDLTKKTYKKTGKYLGVSAAGCDGKMDSFEHEIGVTVLSAIGAKCGKVFYPSNKFTAIKNTMTFTPNLKKINPSYLFYIMKDNKLPRRGGGQPFMAKGDVQKYKIPLPPLKIQKEIVEQIEVKQKAIDSAKEVIKNLERERQYFGQEIRKLKGVERVLLGDILDYEQPTKYIVKSINYKDSYKVPVLTAGQTFILGYTDEKDGIYPESKLPVIIFDDFTTATQFVDFPFKVKSSAMKILNVKDKNRTNIKFVYLAMQGINFDHNRHKRYWIREYSNLKIPLPSLETQKKLISKVDKEDKIIRANRKLIELMDSKINSLISSI